MKIIKRDGSSQKVSFDKVLHRLQRLTEMHPPLSGVDVTSVAQKVIGGIYDGVSTVQLDNLAAETAAYSNTIHPDYGVLASRIFVSNLHKSTKSDWMSLMEDLYRNLDGKTKEASPMISKKCFNVVKNNHRVLQDAFRYERDYSYDFFGLKTLEKSYLLRIDDEIVERPQHMLMRVAVGVHGDNVEDVLKAYDMMSRGLYTHASPTLFSAGTPVPQMSSCFLTGVNEDSIEGIYKTLSDLAKISKSSGGIGCNVGNVRARGSPIKGRSGCAGGLVPMLRVFNETSRYVDQGGKRKGAFAIYVEPWHADVEDFLDLKKNHGTEESRARDLFYGLWIPDLFMERVETDGNWSLFCPNQCKGLGDTYGKEFDSLYEEYEKSGKARKTMKARGLWFKILQSQIETGMPYVMYKDTCNAKSNHNHLGIIRNSNLCTEIVQYSSEKEVAVCNLASVAVNKFVMTGGNDRLGNPVVKPEFDFEGLRLAVRFVTKSLNRIIDCNYYPVERAETSNKKHRPVGIGIQGLADAFALMRYPFCSVEAKELNVAIFETIYFAALEESCSLAKSSGAYSSYEGSMVSKGILAYDTYGVVPSKRWDFNKLKEDIVRYGLKNSLLVAPMPTASTSNILGNTECFEPITSNVYVRRVLSGEFVIVNKHLVKDLIDLGLWSTETKDEIVRNMGSVQNVDKIPPFIKELYKTVWEMSMQDLCEMSVGRAPFVDQSQSFSAFFERPSKSKLTSMHFYTWKKGLKTGMYYLRTRPPVDPIQFTLSQNTVGRGETIENVKTEIEEKAVFTCLIGPDGAACLSCSG